MSLAELLIQPNLSSEEFRAVANLRELYEFAQLNNILIRSVRRPRWSERFASQSRQMERFYAWYEHQRGALVLLSPPASVDRDHPVKRGQRPNREMSWGGICVLLGVNHETAVAYSHGRLSAFDLRPEHLLAPEIATDALLPSVAFDPYRWVDPLFAARAIFTHLRRQNLMREGVRVLAPVADRRRREWFEVLEFGLAGRNKAGRDVYTLQIGPEHQGLIPSVELEGAAAEADVR